MELPTICHSIQLMEEKKNISQNHSDWKGAHAYLLQPPDQRRINNQTVFLMVLCSWVLNTSRDGVHTTPLGNLLQRLIIMFSFDSQDIPSFAFIDSVSHFPTAP